MLSDAPVTAFVATANADRAIAFYRDTLGLRLVSDDPFAAVLRCKGAPLRLQKVGMLQPHPFTSLGWTVVSIRRTVAMLTRRGVAFERYALLEQDDRGIWTAPGGAMVAWFKDPDGNVLSLTQSPRR